MHVTTLQHVIMLQHFVTGQHRLHHRQGQPQRNVRDEAADAGHFAVLQEAATQTRNLRPRNHGAAPGLLEAGPLAKGHRRIRY